MLTKIYNIKSIKEHVGKITTSIIITAESKKIWKSLCNSEMPISPPWFFKFGIPTPKKCRIIGSNEGVNGHRQCQTNEGVVVDQEIIKYVPEECLSFKMTSNEMGLEKQVQHMQDTFFLSRINDNDVLLTRLTEFEMNCKLSKFREIIFKIITKRIHKYTLKGFKILAENY